MQESTVLLEALEDDRLTRAADGDGWIHLTDVLTVGQAAMQVLEAIAGRSFGNRGEAEEWWASVRTLGAERVLADAVRRGGWEACAQAEILARDFPATALGPISEGARRATESFVRSRLVEAAGSLPGDGPVPFLLEEMGKGPLLAGRVAAACGLQARGRTEALAAMIGEWKADRDDRFPVDLVSFLLKTGDPTAVRALADGLASRPAGWRREVALDSWIHAGSPPDPRKPPSREFRNAVEDLLAGLLEDRLPLEGSLDVLGVSFDGMRLCDLAGTGLARLRRTPDSLDLRAPPGRREEQLRALAAAWRMDRGR